MKKRAILSMLLVLSLILVGIPELQYPVMAASIELKGTDIYCLTIGVFSIPLINGLPQEMEEVRKTFTVPSDYSEQPGMDKLLNMT